MNQLFYLPEPISIPGSNLIIIALAKDGSPYGIRKEQFIGDEATDLDSAFALTSYFTRLAERGDEVPNLDDLVNSTIAAVLYGESLYGKGFFSKS
jgi:hypothetical protein